MNPLQFVDIALPQRTHDPIADAGALLAAHGKNATWRHVQGVAEACVQLAERFSLNAEHCRLAGILHDISAVIPAPQMLAYAQSEDLPLDDAEKNHPFLLHQRLSALIAEADFGVSEPEILHAIACHTTLCAYASGLDMALFLADKIAWDQPGEPPFLPVIREALERSLLHACRVYIDYVMDNGMILQPHQDLLAARAWLHEEDA